MDPRQELRKLVAEAKSLAENAEKKNGGRFTEAERTRIAEIKSRADDLKAHIEAANVDRDLLGQLSGQPDPRSVKAAGPAWAKSVLEKVDGQHPGHGAKALLSGPLDTPPAVEVVELPAVPTTLLDLVPRETLSERTYEYVRQTLREINAAVVADGATKPTSRFMFTPVEDHARVIAHLSEPFPLRYLSDHRSITDVLDAQMQAGIVEALEEEFVDGDGLGEHFTGIFHTTGVTQVPYATSKLTTIRHARTVLANKQVRPTAWVFNPADLEEFDLMREDGATGGLLLDAAAVNTIFGPYPRVPSLAVPQGTALLADWSTTRIRVREGAHTLAATQGAELFDKNLVKLRTEGRYGNEIKRPEAIAVVDLTA